VSAFKGAEESHDGAQLVVRRSVFDLRLEANDCSGGVPHRSLVKAQLSDGARRRVKTRKLSKSLVNKGGEERVRKTEGGDRGGVVQSFPGTGAEKREGAVLGNPVLDGKSCTALVHIQRMRGVLIAVGPVDARENQTTFTGMVLLEEFMKTEVDFPSFIENRAAARVGFRGAFRG
jgi:hypothetical protein